MHTRKFLVKIVTILLVIIISIYAAIEARGLFFGPKINLFSPINGSTVSSPIILVEGESVRTKELTVNGNKIFIDTSGKFSVNLVMAPGYNIITIVATDARGAQHTTTSHIYFETEWFNKKDGEVQNIVSTTTSSSTISSTTLEVN
jgi:hypothetical protein